MPPDIKQFSGLLNSDDSSDNIGLTHHRMAMNGRFRGTGNNMRFESVEGTNLISNPYLPAGTNECIGAYFDELNQRIFTFNYNSNSNHAIYQYSLITKLWLRVVQVGYNTDVDILMFDLNNPIYAVKMLYGDDTQGDALWFNNSQKQPCQINIKKALDGTYGTIKRSYIDVIKAPPSIPPALTYKNDITVTVNNMRKKLFKFKIRYVYLTKDKSVWSSQGQLSLPTNYTDTNIDKDPTKNCLISITVPTGEADVIKIEIAAAISEGNTFGDFFLIKVIDKAVENIASNDITTYEFYNNQAYVPIDVEDSIQLFDLVPLQANALEFLNGNVSIYGGILEGYDISTVIGTATSTSEAQQTTQHPFVFVGSQSGDSAFGTGNIHIKVIGSIQQFDNFRIETTNTAVSSTIGIASPTSADVINALSTGFSSGGFTVISSDSENLIIVKAGQSLQKVLATPALRTVTDSFVYDRNARYNYVIVYFDKAGRSIGGLTSNGMNFQTINYTETTGIPNIPKIQFSISSRPPLHAYYYQIGRTKSLTKLKKIEWISDRTYKDADFAYISIESLNVYIFNNPSSKFLAYDFSPNDRIRFMKVLSGSVNTIYTNQDFEIQSQVFNPTINGTIHSGQFLKIALPTTSGTFDFGTTDFYNYFIELYTPAQSVANGLDLDYEFGERYTIGNPGTITAFHQGMLQNQMPDLSLPATFEFTQGDYYYRPRNINTGDVINYNLTNAILAPSDILPQTLVNQSLPSTNYDVAPTVVQQQLVGGYNSPGWTINVNTSTYTFSVKGTINLRAVNTTAANFRVQIYVIYGTTTVLYPLGNQTGANAGDNIVFTANTSIIMPPNSKSFLVMNTADNNFRLNVVSGDLTYMETSKVFTVNVIDPNFSDFFQSAVNSNGRAWFVDANASQVFNPTLSRWGLAYQPNTNINQTNRFKPLNFDECDRSKGQIQAYKARDRICRVFQERGCGQMGVYAKFIQDSNGTNTLTTTDEIITRNNISYYAGIFGVGNQPTGLVSSKIDDYFIDPVRDYQLRLGGNGLIAISELNKGQFYIQPLFSPYNKDYLRANGAKAKILGYYNYFEEEYVSILQGGTFNGNTILDHTFSFNEKRNSYCSFFDFHPEWIICAEDVTYSFKNGQMYIHNNTDKYANFYNQQFYPSINLIFNDKIAIKKTFMALSYQASDKWTAPIAGDILTSQANPQTGLPQISKLKDFNFTIEEGLYYAALQFDINSRSNSLDAWYNGDVLKGVWLELKLTYTQTNFGYLYLPSINWIPSPRN